MHDFSHITSINRPKLEKLLRALHTPYVPQGNERINLGDIVEYKKKGFVG